MTALTPSEAAARTQEIAPSVLERVNDFTHRTFRTRGGRLGSGMGLLLEALWGYYTTELLQSDGLEMAWLADHQYNDFACLDASQDWEPANRSGELFRVEAKSMNLGADESKAHFDEVAKNILPDDLLTVLTWRWETEGPRVWPCVSEIFVDRALPIAHFRDALHIARGGGFVDPTTCPDGCQATACTHAGEPLNANGKRERLSGPEATRVSAKVSHAANFGGLVRMLAARSRDAHEVRERYLTRDQAARAYYAFVQRNLGRVPD